MMQGFRKAGQSWLGRIVITVLFGTLIFSFAIWGIGDMVKNYGTNNAATVGSTEISLAEFRAAYQTEIQNISRRIRRNLTAQEALSFGLDRRVLERLINDATLDEQVRNWGLAINNETIAKAVLADPNFAGPDGSSTGRFLTKPCATTVLTRATSLPRSGWSICAAKSPKV